MAQQLINVLKKISFQTLKTFEEQSIILDDEARVKMAQSLLNVAIDTGDTIDDDEMQLKIPTFLGCTLDWSAGTADDLKVKISKGSVYVVQDLSIANASPYILAGFITTWKTDNTGYVETDENQIKLPLYSSGTYNFTVDWGDETESTITSYDDVDITHTYAIAGTYDVTINGTCDGFGFYSVGDRSKLIDVKQWGNVKLHNQGNQFYQCDKLTEFTATDEPDLSSVTNMYYMFAYATLFNGDISGWDVSNVTNMNTMFYNTAFDQDIGDWDVSNVTNMDNMFSSTPFNQDIGSWDVGEVTTMNNMFSANAHFNQNLNSWDVSKVANMHYMFYAATAFNGNISSWVPSAVTTMEGMFAHTPFNQDISGWNVGNVTNMSYMFYGATNFNQDIIAWSTSDVTDMSYMFAQADSFNQDLSSWNTESVTTMVNMFSGANDFNRNIATWDIANVTDMTDMLIGTSFNRTNYNALLIAWAAENVKDSVPFSVGTTQYNFGGAASSARTHLVDTHSWSITDGGAFGEL